ncbi:MAG: hypothetical protein GXP39_19825 [Chloroflexi bacterium]|nr:hypothetical protein [Chloroflexota bacterium]
MNRRVVSLLSLICFVPIFVFSLAPVGSHAAAGASPARSIVVDVDLPSDSTGVPEGTLAVRIFAPASDDRARYAEGAPVVIFVPGGSDAGSLRPPLSKADDMIRIVFLFPGGTDPVAGRSSDGTYDYRGPDSIAALRDVIRYAAGDLTDSRGRTIDDVVPMPVLHDNIGLVGSSNGGNIVVAVAAKHGGDLAGHLRYIVQWESPVSSQIATVDLGGVRLDCPGGRRAALFTVNPRYGGYGPLMLSVDYRQIAYDPRSPRHPVFLDGNGDGRYTTVVDPSNGCRTPDLDLNGTLEMDEDFPLAGYTDGVKWYYSRPVTQALVDYGVFRGGWPTNIATLAEVSAFWDLREAVRLYSAALTHIPDLEGMVLASVVDHVQAAPDHPHIRQAFEGWDRAGAWVKINPARRYVVAVDSSLSGRTDLPDNAANVAPADWSDTTLYAYPDGLEDAYFAAAVHEMADRARSAGATPTPTATATPTPTPTPSPPPAAPVRRSTVSLNALHGWTAEMGNHLKIFDVAVDEARNRIYVQGILTSGIAVIDGEADTLVASLDSGMDETSSHRTYLAVHPTRGILYVADWHQRTLRAVDPQSGAITGPVTLPGDPFQMVVDAGAERLYVSMRASGEVAVYDAETLALVRVIDLGANRIGGMVLDREGRRLYVVDSDDPGAAQRSRLYVIDTRALAALQPISFRNPFGRPADFVDRDPATGRFFVTTGARLFILSARGAVERAVVLPEGAREPIYWADTGKVYVLSREGISPIRSALSVVDANTGRLEAKVDLGTGGAQHLALNRLTGKLYTPGMEYSEVVVVDARTYQVLGKVDVGNSVEDVAVAPSDGTIYLANRLGGSTVIAYRPDTGAWSEFEAGGWPTAVDVDPGLNRLYVLSHYDGMVFAYDLSSDPPNPTLLGSVWLGLADTRDTISNQIVDATHHRVITTHPEHDRIVIVDGERLEVVATIRDVPSFDAKADLHGRGHLQPAVDEGLNKLYVLSARARKVDVFDGDRGYAYLRTIDLSGYSWSWDRDFNDFLLWVDSGRHRLYVGPLIIDTLTDTYIGQLPADGGQVVVGLDAASDLLYTIGVASASSERPSAGASWSSVDARRPTCQPRCATSDEQPRVFRLYILDRDTYAVKDRIDLRALTYVPPYVALDAARARFYAGYMQTAEVDIYTLGGTAPSPSPTPTPGAPCRVYLPQTSTDPRRSPWPSSSAIPSRRARSGRFWA